MTCSCGPAEALLRGRPHATVFCQLRAFSGTGPPPGRRTGSTAGQRRIVGNGLGAVRCHVLRELLAALSSVGEDRNVPVGVHLLWQPDGTVSARFGPTQVCFPFGADDTSTRACSR